MLLNTKAHRWAKGIFFGWWVLATCMVMQILTASFTMQSFGAYIAVMKEEFGWSTTVFSVAFAIQQASGGFLGPVIGWLVQRFGPRRVVRVGLIIFCLGLIFLSTIQSIPMLYASVIVLALGASLAGFLPLNTVAVQWFERRRSTALALMQTGISLAGFIVPVVAWALVNYGWRATALATSLLVFCIGMPLSRFIGNAPEDYGLEPDGGSIGSNTSAPEAVQKDITANEALKTRAFWFISFGHGLALMIVFAILAHLIVFLTEERSFSLQVAGIMVAVMTAMSIVGQLLGGFLGDKLNKRLLATAAMFGHALALIMLAYGTSIIWIVGFTVLHGIAWGLRAPIMQSIRADYFGRKYFGQIMGYSSVIVTVGIMVGPLLAGTFADAYGSYKTGFTLLALLAALGSVFFIFSTPPKLHDETRA